MPLFFVVMDVQYVLCVGLCIVLGMKSVIFGVGMRKNRKNGGFLRFLGLK